MAELKAWFTKNYWRYSFSLKNAVKSTLAVFAVLWLLTEIVAFFSASVGEAIRTHWPVFLLLGFGWTLWESRPRLSMSERVAGKDAVVEICVGDCLEKPGSLVIGSNTAFRTAGLDPTSLQAQFAQRFCGSPEQLEILLAAALAGEPGEPAGAPGRSAAGGRAGSAFASAREPSSVRAGRETYAIGTTARIAAGDKEAYFTAIAELNEYGRAQSSAERLRLALDRLWSYMARRGSMGALVMPVLGSGLSRIGCTRVELIRTIVRSFVAACGAGKFAERLTIVIHPRDFQTYDIDLEELRFFLKYACAYGGPDDLAGTPAERPEAIAPAATEKGVDKPHGKPSNGIEFITE